MRLLLVSDTHGSLAGLNTLARETRADAILHAGDFGFYDEDSVDRLSDRELRLRILHSGLTRGDKQRLASAPVEEQKAFIRANLPLSELPNFMRGEQTFVVSVYAVWGNHEDVGVVRKFVSGDYHVPGLHLVHSRSSWRVGPFRIYGLGGNVLIGPKFFQPPLAGSRGKLWSVLAEYIDLLDHMRETGEDDEVKRIMLTHVSPGKEPLITLMGILSRADLMISGHMDPPLPLAWQEFAVRSSAEAVERVRKRVEEIYASASELDEVSRRDIDTLLARLDVPISEIKQHGKRDGSDWYYRTTNINLPDVPSGYAVIEDQGDRVAIEAVGQV